MPRVDTPQFHDPFIVSSPLCIPPRRSVSTSSTQTVGHLSALLAETRIPPRFSKTRRKASTTDRSHPAASSPPRTPPRPQRRSSLFAEVESDGALSTSLPDTYSYLLTPPSSVPDLSRSVSTLSMDSDISIASSQFSKSPRINLPIREEVNLSLEDPLVFNVCEVCTSETSNPPAPTGRRRSSLGNLLKPLKSVAPRVRASALVSSLSLNLSSWAASLAASQYDEYGLVPNVTGRGNLHIPRPVQVSGPRKPHATIIEAEMERAPLPFVVEEVDPIYVELKPWTTDARTQQRDAGRDGPDVHTTRSREPRLNPDFLRVLVLESNMRKQGKISQSFGRARMILEPRCSEHGASALRQSVTL